MKEAEKTSKQKRKDKQAERPRKQIDKQARNLTRNPEEKRIIGTTWKMKKHAALEAKIGHDIAEHEPQQAVEKRTKEGGTPYNFSPRLLHYRLTKLESFESLRQLIWTLHVYGEQIANKWKTRMKESSTMK